MGPPSSPPRLAGSGTTSSGTWACGCPTSRTRKCSSAPRPPLGCGLREKNDGGLTEFGRAAVERMNKLGIAIDISHSGDQTSLDTIQVSSKPIFITHAGARGLCETARMKPDSVLKTCAERGGVIGIEAAPHTTLTKAHPKHSIESFMEHFEYCVSLMGIDHVAFGPDTLFSDHVALHHAFARQ